jgi:aspartate kinase
MAMTIVVQKYGGSSVAGVERLKRVAQRVVDTARAGHRVCVVISAMGDSTDELLGLARQVSAQPPRRELDMLLSCGERIAMALLSMAIAELGHEAISFTGSQSGIMTNDRHSGARIIEVRPVRIEDELERGKIVIVAGFQGVSYRREITTLGRGGSDTTAVALAAALGAEYCEICSDVEGIYSADPRVVDAARLLHAISYDEMQELAEHGARVMNPQAVEFARKAGIAIYARATAGTPGQGGTRIAGPGDNRGAVGVTGQRGLVRVRGGQGLGALLADEGVRVLRLVDGSHPMALFTIDDLPDWPRVRGLLDGSGLGAEVEEDLAWATCVGEGIGSDARLVGKLRHAILAAGLPFHGVDSAPLRVSFLTTDEALDQVVCLLHAELCAPAATPQ